MPCSGHSLHNRRLGQSRLGLASVNTLRDSPNLIRNQNTALSVIETATSIKRTLTLFSSRCRASPLQTQIGAEHYD